MSEPSNLCVICGSRSPMFRVTCSPTCHEKFVEAFTDMFGKYVKVVDIESGRTHKVPRRDIIEKGLRYEDLRDYPTID